MSPAPFRLSPSVSEAASSLLAETLASYVAAEDPRLVTSYVSNFDEVRLTQRLQLHIEGQGSFARRLDLKRKLALLWNEAPERRLQIADYCAQAWGGIRSDSKTRAASCVAAISAGHLPKFSGIASWSRIASAADPHEFAVFDASAALSLNALQLLSGGTHAILFPSLRSRNKLFRRVDPLLQRAGQALAWESLPQDEVYPAYLALLRRCTTSLEGLMQMARIEMVLLATAEDLARRAEIKMYRRNPAETAAVTPVLHL